MSVYGNQIINEGFFLSPDGKSIKKQIKEICKENKEKFSLTKAIMSKYNLSLINKVIDECEKIFDKFFVNGPIIVETTTYSNGSSETNYFQEFVGIKGNKIYSYRLYYYANTVRLYVFNELLAEECKYDIKTLADILSLILKAEKVRIQLTKKAIIYKTTSRQESIEVDKSMEEVKYLLSTKFKDKDNIKLANKKIVFM